MMVRRLLLCLLFIHVSDLYGMDKNPAHNQSQSKDDRIRPREEAGATHEEGFRRRRRLMVVVTPAGDRVDRCCGMLCSPIDEAGNVHGPIFVFSSAASMSSVGSDEDHREIDYPDSDPDASEDESDRDEFI